jgi:membrane protease subunit HflC
MRHRGRILVSLVIVLILLVAMVTYQVPFNEAAVVTTFGRASQGSVQVGSTGGGVLGNLHLRWPWPIQKVRRYDLRVHILEDQLEEQQTQDRQGVVMSTYVAWSIADPLAFHRALVTEEEAEVQLRSLLRDARSVVGSYTFADLTASDPERLRLGDVENAMLNRLTGTLDRFAREAQPWGLRVERVGIRTLILPEAVTEKVFERMRATRERLAQRARSEGDAMAADIRARARSTRKTILAFAEARAQDIRAEGDAAAAEYYHLFAQDPDLAIFLRKLETYEEVLSHNSTFFFDSSQGVFPEFLEGPVPSEGER